MLAWPGCSFSSLAGRGLCKTTLLSVDPRPSALRRLVACFDLLASAVRLACAPGAFRESLAHTPAPRRAPALGRAPRLVPGRGPGPLPQDLGQSQDVEQGAEVEVEGLEGREVEEVEAQLPVGHQLGFSS